MKYVLYYTPSLSPGEKFVGSPAGGRATIHKKNNENYKKPLNSTLIIKQ